MTRGAAPVAWCCTRYVAVHPIRSGAMPTDWVYRAPRQERVRNLESRNAKESGISSPIHNPGLGRQVKRRYCAGTAPVMWRCTRCVALHPLRRAAPVTWRCTRTERVQCPRIGCNAYGSGVPRSQTRTCVEPGIPQREGKRHKLPYTQPGTWQANQGGDITRGAAPVAWRCTRCVALHPIRSGAMPTDRVYRARRQERVRNMEPHNAKESGLSAPYINPGTWQTCDSP